MSDWEDVLADQEELNAVLEAPSWGIDELESEELERELDSLAAKDAVTIDDLERELEKLALSGSLNEMATEASNGLETPQEEKLPDVAHLDDPSYTDQANENSIAPKADDLVSV
jgi:hypothetical protein